jgi:hypothetical protein
MTHVKINEFERCHPNELFQGNDILDGFSPGEIALQEKISTERVAEIQE